MISFICGKWGVCKLGLEAQCSFQRNGGKKQLAAVNSVIVYYFTQFVFDGGETVRVSAIAACTGMYLCVGCCRLLMCL